MLASKIHFKVEHITEETVDINGYEYTKVEVTLPKDLPMSVLIGLRCLPRIKEGNYYFADRAYLTSKNLGKNAVSPFTFRVDYVSDSIESDYNMQRETTVNVNCKYKRRTWNDVRPAGPMLVPTFSTKMQVQNESKDMFYVLILGFHGRAILLSNLSKSCYVDITGTLSAPRTPGKPCAIIVKNIVVRKELEA